MRFNYLNNDFNAESVFVFLNMSRKEGEESVTNERWDLRVLWFRVLITVIALDL